MGVRNGSSSVRVGRGGREGAYAPPSDFTVRHKLLENSDAVVTWKYTML